MFKYENKLGAGCYGTVYPLEADKVIKFGSIDPDREFFELFAAKSGVDIFPKYYGVRKEVFQEYRDGKLVTDEAEGIVVQRLKMTFGEAIAVKALPYVELENKLLELEEKLSRFVEETGVVIDDLHSNNLMFDENMNLYISDVGVWGDVEEYGSFSSLYAWDDLQQHNYGSECFLDEIRGYNSRRY